MVDRDLQRARDAAEPSRAEALGCHRELIGKADAAIVATPTVSHAEIAVDLLEAGIDVLVEKPISTDLPSADRMIGAARANDRILQVGHLERFNPVVAALESIATLPLFFEIHRMSVFSRRSLDIDVVLDLMIHDLDIVMALTPAPIADIRAAGVSILSPRVDIANVRLEFENGCIANLTASRASTEKIRKLRLFQPREYVSADYTRQEMLRVHVTEDREISFQAQEIEKAEPLRLQYEAFLHSVRSRRPAKVNGSVARRVLEAALAVNEKIEEHARVVQATLARQ